MPRFALARAPGEAVDSLGTSSPPARLASALGTLEGEGHTGDGPLVWLLVLGVAALLTVLVCIDGLGAGPRDRGI
jgi:hypothetical protein